jgi:hypothetical protein
VNYYEFGVKLALADAGLASADELAQLLRSTPDVAPTNDVKNDDTAIGEPDNPNSTFSGNSTSFGNDLLTGLGLDVRGPESTSV